MAHRVVNEVKSLESFPSGIASITDGKYAIKSEDERELSSSDATIQAELWFKSPPLDLATIRRIDSLQLVAESHDQGFASVPSAGNWTWLELAILEDDSSWSPRIKDGVELVWKSHYNSFMSADYVRREGTKFRENHDLLRSLESGNVIAVRLCARFAGWKIAARNGCLIVEIGTEEVEREPPQYGQIVFDIKNIQDTFQEVNLQTQSAFMPSLPEGLFSAEALGSSGKHPLRVLSLDGGGVRGLSALRLLKAVMDRAAPGQKPCEIFDMIGGTSTGGLIAIMLGRLKMTVDECIEKYKGFMKKVFNAGIFGKKGHFIIHQEFYDAGVLEGVIKDLIRERIGKDDAELLNEADPCKIFVMAVRKDAANNRGPVFLRSYRNPQEMSILPSIKLWQAARATSAAPAYFAPIKVGDYELVDGGLGANNPLGWLWTEVLGVFGPARPTACFLSLGTGIAANTTLPNPGRLGSHEVEGAFAAIASNTEIVNILFRSLINSFAPAAMAKKYWRLNVSEEIAARDEKTGKETIHHHSNFKDVGDLDDIGALDALMQMTEMYVQTQAGSIEECAKALVAK